MSLEADARVDKDDDGAVGSGHTDEPLDIRLDACTLVQPIILKFAPHHFGRDLLPAAAVPREFTPEFKLKFELALRDEGSPDRIRNSLAELAVLPFCAACHAPLRSFSVARLGPPDATLRRQTEKRPADDSIVDRAQVSV